MIITFIIVLISLAFSALFSGSEIAFISVNKLKIELKSHQGSRSGQILSNFFDKPSKFLGTMLIGNNIALVIFGMLTENILKEPLQNFLPYWLSGDFAVLLSLTILTTIIVLVFGEFIPKTIFRIFAERSLLLFARLLWLIYTLLFPIVWVAVRLSELLLKVLFRTNIEENQRNFTRLDLELFITDAGRNQEDDVVDTKLFNKALDLKEITVKSCMIPLKEVEAIDINESINQLKAQFIESQFSRILVFRGKREHIMGYVHQQNLFDNPNTIEEILLPISSVNLNDDGYRVINSLIRQKKSIAYVINAEKMPVGMLTLEDILEEIFGEIDDEHD